MGTIQTKQEAKLIGKSIYLRPIEEGDTKNVVKWRNQEFVRRNFIYQQPFTEQGHRNWLETKVKTGEVVQFIICLKESGLAIGSVYFRDVNQEYKKAEYGIFIGEEEYLGKGYGTEAADLAVTYAFHVLKLHKIMLRLLADNDAARRSYEKAGFHQEAYLQDEVRIQEQYRDIIYMAKMNEEQIKKERFVIIGANEFQNPLIIRAKEKGLETHVFAWEEGAVGKENADYFYPISITEKEAILEECRKLKPVGIASIGSDLAMLTVNYVAEQLGLASNSIACTRVSTNKYLMRKTFEQNGDPSPRYALSEEKEAISHFTYPLIVKPTDRSGSRGIMKIESPSQLEEAIANASHHAFDKKAIVEEFIEGKEYSVEYISYQGEHTFLALTEKFTTGAPHFIETGHREPAIVSQEMLQKVQKVVEHALNSLQVTCGASHSEVMITKDGEVKIVEIGARMGGDCIGSDLVKLSTGYDFVDMVIQTACGKRPQFVKVCKPRPVRIQFLFGQADLEVLEEYKKNQPERICCISEIELFNHEITDSASRYGYYIRYDD